METFNESKKAAIIKAAGEIFIENGYRAATVRQICSLAGVNVAAINYYFGDKKNLYLEVLRYYKEIAFKKYPLDWEIKKTHSPRQKLKSFIHSMILRMLEEGPSTRFGKLLAREFVEPTDALDTLIDDVFRPSFLLLTDVVKEIWGKKAAEKEVNLCVMSIMGQCVYFRNSSKVVSRILKKEKFSNQEIREFAEHVYHFSLLALENYFKAR
jgi:hypothetical protein